MTSEIILLEIDTSVTPIDLGGAKQVIMQASSNPIQISTDRSFNDFFSLLPSDADKANFTLSVASDDEYLYAKSGGTAYLEIWVVK